MTTWFQDKCYTPLDAEAAQRVVADLQAVLDRYIDASSAEAPSGDETYEGLTVITRAQHRDDEEDGGAAAIVDDFDITFEPNAPPTVAEARASAEATGYTPYLDPAALDRLATCRSIIVLDYAGRVSEHPLAISLQRRLFEAIGPSVVVTGEGSKLDLSESHVAGLQKAHGSRWLRETATEKRAAKKPRVARAAKPGEVESVTLRNRLDAGIEDPFVAGRLQAELRETTDAVRMYAALLLEEGAQADARAAKPMGRTAEEVAEIRDELDLLVARAVRANRR